MKKSIFEPPHKKNQQMARAPSEDSDQTGHPAKTQISLGIRPV